MEYWSTNHNKRKFNKNMSIEYKNSIFNSENNDNEQKSKNTSINIHSFNLFKDIVKITKRTLKEKKSPEAQSNIVNNDNNIFDFTNFVYNNEEHLEDDKFSLIKSPKYNNAIRNDNIISLSSTLRSKNRTFNKNKSALELLDLSKNIYKEKNLKKSLFNKNSKRISLNYNNSIIKTKPRRRSLIGDMTNKNRNSHNFNFFFKLKEKDKIPSKTPYLDKIWNFSNKSNLKHKTNINKKQNSEKPLITTNSHVIKMNIINKKKANYEKDNVVKKQKDKLVMNKVKEAPENRQEEKIESNETKKIDNINENILYNKKEQNTKIIFNILNKPFFCCLK